MNTRGLLDELEIEIAHEDRINFNCYCPIHDDSNASFGLNRENGLWLCRAGCGSGNALQLLQRILGCSYDQAKTKLAEFSDPKSEIVDVIRKKIERFASSSSHEYKPPQISPPHSYEPFVEGPLPSFDSPISQGLQYLVTRMSFGIATDLKIGVCTTGRYANRLIIPISMFGTCVGFIARAIDPNSEKRYLNATNVLYNHLLYNYDAPIGDDGEIYLCESTFDCITMIEAGKPTMATFGARISYRQIELLLRKSVKRIIFCFHSDMAGDKGVNDKLSLLSRLFTVHRMKIPTNTDLNALGPLMVNSLMVDTLIDDKAHRILNSIQWKLEKS